MIKEIQMSEHSLRVRAKRWEKIEKKAWELSIKMNKVVKPTDVADAILAKYIDKIEIEDIENAKKTR